MITVRIQGPQGSGKTLIAEGLLSLLRACGKRAVVVETEESVTKMRAQLRDVDPRTEVLIVTEQNP